jgi:general secretion pathway protein I
VNTIVGTPAASRRSRGFTLLEVLVALAVFATASIVLASAYINILNGYDVAARANEADSDVAFARSLVLTMADRKKLEEGGQFDTAEGGHVRWSVEINSTNTADVFSVNFTCEVTPGGNREPEKTVETFTLLRPTWTIDAAEHDKLREDAKKRILDMQGQQGGAGGSKT